jgi:mannose-1-phosphate guanylyltransferase
MALHAVVLAGGAGSRLWPVSAPDRPKQVQALFGPEPLVGLALDRATRIAGKERSWVLVDQAIASEVAAVLPGLHEDHLLLEPVRRGTLAAVALAAAYLARIDADAVIAFLPADHVCQQPGILSDAVRLLAGCLGGGVGLVGTVEDELSAELGHLRVVGPASDACSTFVGPVDRYIEKPAPGEVEQDGHWYRNMGIVVVAATTVATLLPADVIEAAAALAGGADDALGPWNQIDEARFEDHVLPAAPHLLAAVAALDWIDVGTWPTLMDAVADGGVLRSGSVSPTGSERCVAVSTGPDVHLLGVEDLLVVATPTTVIVCHRDDVAAVAARSATRSPGGSHP